jgi:hypothetical protein
VADDKSLDVSLDHTAAFFFSSPLSGKGGVGAPPMNHRSLALQYYIGSGKESGGRRGSKT